MPQPVTFFLRPRVFAVSLLVLCALAFAPLLLHSQQVPADAAALESAKVIDIGSFCLSDIPAGAIVVGRSHYEPDGYWWEVRITIKASDPVNTKPTAYFFSKLRSPSADGKPTSCKDPSGNSFLTGRLNSATIDALFRPGGGLTTDAAQHIVKESSRWHVDPGKFNVEFGKAQASIGPLYGAFVVANDAQANIKVLQGRKLWVSNPAEDLFFNRTAGIQSGILDLETADVTLSKLELRVTDEPVPIDLSCHSANNPRQGNVIFTMNVATSEAGFISGECSKPHVDLPAGLWTEGGVVASVASVRAGRVVLTGKPIHPELSFMAMTLKSPSIKYGQGIVAVVPKSDVVVNSLSGPVQSPHDTLQFERATWNGVKIPQAGIQVTSSIPIDGEGEIDAVTLSQDKEDVSIKLSSATLPSLTPIIPITITSASLRAVGPLSSPFVEGSIEASSVQLAALGLHDKIGPFTFQNDPKVTNGAAFPFDLDLSTPEGKATIGDPDGQNVRLSGQLKKLHLKGAVRLDPQSSDPYVSVDPGGLVLDASVQASVSPLVLGSPVQFVGASVSLGSPGGLQISKSRSTGSIDLAAQGLIMATPSLVFSNPDEGFLVQAPMRTEGAAVLQFDIGSGRAKIQNGRIVADNLEAKSLDTAKNVSIAGITLVSPDLTLANLIVAVTEGAGLVQGQNLHFVTGDVTHNGPPYWKVSLAPDSGLTIPKFDAQLGDTEKGLILTQASVDNLKIQGLSAEFRSIDGFDVAGTTFSISADKLTDKVVTNGLVSIANGTLAVATSDQSGATNAKAGFDGFSLSLDGSKDALSGTGKIHLHDISVGGRYTLPISKCGGGNGWKITGALDIAQVSLDLNLNASKVAGTADVNGGRSYIVNDGESSCGWDEHYVLATINPCFLWGSCDVKIEGDIYWEADLIKLDASATIQQAVIAIGGNKGAQVCLRQVNLSPPVIAATYSPNIRKGGFVADLIHNLIRTIAAGVETPIAALIGTNASFVTYLSGLLGTICAR